MASLAEVTRLDPGPAAVLLAELVRDRPALFGLAAPAGEASVRVTVLGEGESYRACRVEWAGAEWAGVKQVRPGGQVGPGGQSGPGGKGGDRWPDGLVVRIPRRPATEMPRPMSVEFAALAACPPGLGPLPVHLEERPQVLGLPYMVTTFVPGRVIPADRWTDGLLAAHATQLARLHDRVHRDCGEITAAAGGRATTLSLLDRLGESVSWWTGSRPDIVAEPEVSRLLPRVEAFIRRSAPAFSRLSGFALVHGDLVAPNILLDTGGVPRYVDWEWAEIGDPARDLAYIGGSIPAEPWYCALDPVRVRAFLERYAAESRHAEFGTVANLEERRAAWEVFERFFSSLHCRTLRGSVQDVLAKGRYTEAVQALTSGLEARTRGE